jgi:hypothetical protein
MMNIEVTVKVVVESGDDWNLRVFDALHSVGSEIYQYPQYIQQKGDGSDFTFEYTVKGTGGLE